MTKCHLIVSFFFFFKVFLNLVCSLESPGELLKIPVPGHTLNHLNQNLWGCIPDIKFIKAPQVVSLCSRGKSQYSGRTKTSSEVSDNRNINHQLKMKERSILSLLSSVWYWTLYFQLKTSVWKLLCVIMPPNVLCSLVSWPRLLLLNGLPGTVYRRGKGSISTCPVLPQAHIRKKLFST